MARAGLGFGAVTVVKVPDAKVALSTASVYPESTANAFEMAARLGYDGVEVMVSPDPVSRVAAWTRRARTRADALSRCPAR